MHIDPVGTYGAPLPVCTVKTERKPWLALVNAVMALAKGAGETGAETGGELLHHAERPWASATFSGSRHTIALHFSGEAAIAAGERLIALLPEHEFTLPGQLVADATVVSARQQMLPEPLLHVEVELLLVEDGR